jgi:hypothetical protein
MALETLLCMSYEIFINQASRNNFLNFKKLASQSKRGKNNS